MHILILGAKGTLGQALVDEFSTPDNTVTAFDKADLDITDIEAVRNALEMLQPDVVINAVAINAVDDIEINDQLFELGKRVNGYVVGEIAQLTKELNIIFVHISTDYVFDGENKNGYTEDALTNPISRYAETKLLGEIELQKNTDQYYLVRISRLFGKQGESPASKKSFVDTMLELSKTKTHLDVVDNQFSCPSYAPDVAMSIKTLLEEKKPFGMYHGANAGACSWFEWAQEIFKIKNINIDVASVPAAHFPRPAKAPMYSELLNTKLPQQRSWQDALKEYLDTV